MNAAEQAHNLQLTSKIAAIANIFKTTFPDAKADLTPWRSDPDTQEWVDPDSIDLGFHFPGWSPRLQGRSILVQVRFHCDLDTQIQRLIGVEVAAFNHRGEAWRLSTIDHWRIEGQDLPYPDVTDKLKSVCRQIFELFAISDSAC
ncbi:hypothetical protein PN441_12290 [Spirulina major CS-329]|uniref:hypothetical protein n=1 Tax=Spirulina TaxID=1154 RepID=UPI00232E3DDD|nr:MULTISPECIES: hypothetical protein [Spirulina]MDB9493540.1 hypothetical protein [Spirulina subsalsa CS-330]MDB9503852.1 hypothetical protein [Spirulina major CS-329]